MSSKTDEVRAALRKLIDQEGASCLKDARRFRSLWLDYVPSQSKEAKLILSAVQEGVGGVLLNAVDQDEAGQRQSIRRCEQRLTDAFITEDGARFAVREIASAMRIDVDRVAPLPVSDSGTEQQTKNSQANSSVPEQSPKSQAKDQDSGRERNTRQEQEPSRREDDRSYEEFLANNAAKEAPAKQKKRFPVLLLLLLLIGGAAAGLFLSRGGNSVPDPVPPVDVQDTENDLSGIVPPILPVEPPEEESEEEPAEEPEENENLVGVVPPVLPVETEEPVPAEPETLPYEIDTIVSNLSGLHSMVMDNANNLYYIDSGIVYSTKDDITLDLEDFGAHETCSYLAYDQYNDIVYLLVGDYTFSMSTGYNPEIYDITDFSSPTLVLDSQSCPALRKIGFNSCDTVAPQIAVLDNGALLVPFQSEFSSSVVTYMVNIEQQSATVSDSLYSNGSYYHAKLLGDKVFSLADRSSADVWTFAAQSSTKTSVKLDYDILSNWGSSSICSKYGVVYAYLASIGVCTFSIDGTVDVLIPAESIAIKDYQSIDDVSVCCLAVGEADQVAFYDNFLKCIRLIHPARESAE